MSALPRLPLAARPDAPAWWVAIAGWPHVRAVAARVYPRGTPDWRRRRLALQWSALRHARAHAALATFLDAPRWRPLLAAHPQLLQKIHKPFGRRGLTVAARAALVRTHYELLPARLGEPALRAIARQDDLALGTVALPGGQGALPVRLGKHPRFEREGELTLALDDPFGSLLYSITFTLVDDGAGPGLLVGSLNGTAPLDTVRHLTRLAHGVRPQSLLFALLQGVAARLGATHLRAVGRRTHAYWGNPRHAEIHFDYDAFWREEGGVEDADGLFALPLAPRRRAVEAIPTRKRALYQRRYAWLDEVDAALGRAWAALPAG